MLKTKDLFGRDLHVGDLVFIPNYVSTNWNSFLIYVILKEMPKSIKLIAVKQLVQTTDQVSDELSLHEINTSRSICLCPINFDIKPELIELLDCKSVTAPAKEAIRELLENL